MDPKTAMYVAQGIHGLAYGMILFLIASGLNMIFGMMGILNLAHTAFFMLSAYFCYQFITWTGSFWLALLLAPIITAIFGILLERLILRKVHVGGHLPELIVTVGFGMVILAAVKIFWGTESLPVKMPPVLEGLVIIAGMEYPVYRLFVIGLALLVLLFMALLLYKTRLGKIVQAAVSDADMVNALGINIPLVFMVVFGVGTWLGGVAGVVIAPILTVFPGLDGQVGMDAFMVVVTGGFGSLMGAFIVSIIFGLLSSYGVQFFSALAPVLMFAFMAIVLAIRPMGLFGERE
ncbi:MAG: branched-chain amino acid ABC transporter permease [Deltaproteobacteria bacterium]|nr:branched-chain amino acid ABC transporter permease [Deltaproteobacteria bacterium]